MVRARPPRVAARVVASSPLGAAPAATPTKLPSLVKRSTFESLYLRSSGECQGEGKVRIAARVEDEG
jgi:hypothetical protein